MNVTKKCVSLSSLKRKNLAKVKANSHIRNSFALLSAGIIVLAGCGKLNEEIAGLRSEIGTLTERVAAIENTQIKAHDEQIASIENEVASLKAADKVLSESVSELEGKMEVVTSDLATLKNSVAALEGTSEELSGKIAAINTKISQMETKITSILSSIEDLKSKAEAAGVTLSYIPKYSDNVERVQITRDGVTISGSASLWFTVSPESAAESIAKNWESSLSALSFYTLTKADGGDAAELSVTGASVKDGILAITVNADNLGKDFILGNLGATLAFKVSCGDIKTVSPYINLAPAIEESFITYLLQNFDSDGDGQIETEKMSGLTSLDLSGMNVKSLDGVLENMPALTSLDCSNNDLTSLDLSKNEKLTSVNLTGNANLTKVVCKSFEWFEGCSISSDAATLFYLSDGTQVVASTVIDGNRWMNYNLGTSESNLYGSSYNFDNAQTACPTGWRVPTKDELESLSANYSDWTTYLGMSGRWFSGSQAYSSSVSAIFLPTLSSSASGGYYWSSTEYISSYAYRLDFGSGYVGIGSYYRSYEWSVRCLKD